MKRVLFLSTQVKLGTSEPIGSVEFRRFLYYRIPVQISSDEFRSVPIGSVDFQRIPGRNFAELTGTFPTKSGPESCSKEIVGIQRNRPKINGIYRIRCRKTKKTTGSGGRNGGPGEKPKYNQLLDIEDGTNEIHQRFTIFATIADICGENRIGIDHQSLLYADDFVPSTDTQLVSFLTVSPIRFTLIDGNLPVTITIQNNEDHRLIKFHCSLTITVKRLCFIACQLFGVNSNYYRLKQAECLMDDDAVTLDDIDSTMTEIQFQLISTASITSSIYYDDQTVLLPCRNETSAATLIVEALHQLHIPQENRDKYELIALADDRTPIEEDMSIEDVYQLFPSQPTTIPFELTTKVE